MAFEGYMSFKGKTQGQFKGTVPRKQGGHPSVQGSISIYGFKYVTGAPIDSVNGASTGRRRHSPVVVTREVDSSSPTLLQASLTRAPFDSVEIVFPRPNSGKGPVLHNKIELTNGSISHISFAPSRNGKRREAVTLEFEAIKINGAPGTPNNPQSLWWRDTW